MRGRPRRRSGRALLSWVSTCRRRLPRQPARRRSWSGNDLGSRHGPPFVGLFAEIRLAAQADLEGFENAEEIQHARGGEQTRAVVSRGARNVGTGGVDRVRQEIKDAAPEIGKKAEHIKGVTGATRSENVTAHQQAR